MYDAETRMRFLDIELATKLSHVTADETCICLGISLQSNSINRWWRWARKGGKRGARIKANGVESMAAIWSTSGAICRILAIRHPRLRAARPPFRTSPRGIWQLVTWTHPAVSIYRLMLVQFRMLQICTLSTLPACYYIFFIATTFPISFVLFIDLMQKYV